MHNTDKELNGALFAKMAQGGAASMRNGAEEVNRLNVFPVPDGDTGDNMRLTIESGVSALENRDTSDLAEVMNALAKGMLLGARGNSGVILSQFFSGMAKGVAGHEKADAAVLGEALSQGVRTAYASVVSPTEGTILTVAREAVEYAVSRLNEASTVRSLFADLVNEAYASLQRTPELLPILRETGRIDSGGAGLFYIMDGFRRVLEGDAPSRESEQEKESGSAAEKPAVPGEAAAFGPDSELSFGYCTEVLLQLLNRRCDIERFDLAGLRAFLTEVGDSVIAIQDGSLVKLHVHTKTPDRVLARCQTYGEFRSVKIENMTLQHRETLLRAADSAPRKKYGVAAVCSGEGMHRLFRELGADVTVDGASCPSAGDFLTALRQIPAEHLFLLPNNGNAVLAARQAASLYREAAVHVIETKDPGAGYAVLSAFDPDSSTPEAVLAAAEEETAKVRTAFLSPSVRQTELDGVKVSRGDFIGLCGGHLIVARRDRTTAVQALLGKLGEAPFSYLLAFCGKDAPEEERLALAQWTKNAFPEAEIYWTDGGQEVYPYIFTVDTL